MISGAQKSFKKAIRSLLIICQGLPALPRKPCPFSAREQPSHPEIERLLTNGRAGRRSLGVNLLYNATCPNFYEPAGFVESTRYNPFASEDAQTVASFKAGSYQVEVGAIHPKAMDFRMNDTSTSRQLQAMQRSSSLPSNLISTQSEGVTLAGGQGTMPSASLPTPPEAAARVNTQPSSPLVSSPTRGPGLRTDWVSPRQPTVVPAKMAELIVQAWGLELNNQGPLHLLDTDGLQKYSIRRLNPGNVVHCECTSEHKEDAMVRLSIHPFRCCLHS